jgi:integrase
MNPEPHQNFSDLRDKISKIIEHLLHTPGPYACFLLAMRETGMRLSDILGLDPASSIDGESGNIRVSFPHAKTEKIVRTDPESAQLLQAYLIRYPSVEASRFRYQFKRAATELGFPHVTLHQVRLLALWEQSAKHTATGPADPTSATSAE